MAKSLDPSRRRLAFAAAGLALHAALPSAARAEDWPSRPLRIVVPFAPGGASDAIARILAEQLPKRLGQPVVIENKPGGSTIIGVDTVVKAPPDGYTLLLAGVGSFSVLPALRKKLPFDIARDLAPLALVNYTPNILVTAAHMPYRTLADLVKAAKASPNTVRYATYGDGSANHLCGVLLATTAGIEMEPIPYKGAADAKLALLRGDVDLSFETLASVGGELKSGRLRALAHGGAGRTSLLPDLPGLADYGYAQAAVQPFFGVAVASAVPEAIRARLAKELLDVMAQPDVRSKAVAAYLEPAAIGPAEMTEIIKTSTATFRRVAQQLKLSLD
jgi:tripartite-type tricarboxylate transporter receptor subunit TctC